MLDILCKSCVDGVLNILDAFRLGQESQACDDTDK